jgi:hypothetical protein
MSNDMGEEMLAGLGLRILADLARSSLSGALTKANGTKRSRSRMPKSAQPLSGEDMDARLRQIRRYVTPRELAALLHWHVETVYRKVKGGMPADRDVDQLGHGRCLKIYPPEIADWLRDCRQARALSIQGAASSQTQSHHFPRRGKGVNRGQILS